MRTDCNAAVRALAAALLCASGLACAEPEPVGAAVTLSRPDDGGQGMPQVQRRPDGRYVAVWHTWNDSEPPEEILGRVLNPDGTPAGERFAVNQQSHGVQLWPDVAVDRYGNAVVVWLALEAGAQKELGLFARRFGPDGAPLGDEFQVNVEPPGSMPANTHLIPQIAMAPDGRFIVVWMRQPGGAIGRLFDAQGQPRGEPFTIDALGTGTAIAMGDDGSFLAAYTISGAEPQVFVRGYDADGTITLGPTLVGAGNVGAIGVQADGAFQVAWFANEGSGTLLLRRFSAAGVGADPVLVATESAIHGMAFDVAPSGAATVAWVTGEGDLQARAYDSSASPDGNAFAIGGDPPTGIRRRGLAHGAPGFFLVAWDGYDGSDYGVYGRVFGPPGQQPPATTPLPPAPPLPPPLPPPRQPASDDYLGNTRLGGALAPSLLIGFALGAALRRRSR